MPIIGQKVTLTHPGNAVFMPAWREPSCTARWDGETFVRVGMEGVIVERCPTLDEPEYESEWWIVQFGDLYAPCEIHDMLVFA